MLSLHRFWEPPALDTFTVRLYGYDTFCHVVAQVLDLELLQPAPDWLATLDPDLSGRAITRTSLAEALDGPFPRFVKSLIPKQLAARVYASAADLSEASTGLEREHTEVIVSAVVEFVAEVRTFVLDGVVLTGAVYEGRSDDLAAAFTCAERLAATNGMPRSVVIDVGLCAGGWVPVEANASWGAGLNGCDPHQATHTIEAATRPR